MSKLLSNLLKFFLLLLLAAVIALLGYWLHVRFEWTYLMLAGLFAGVLAFSLFIFLFRRIYYRKREESFIRSIVDQDAPTLKLQEEQSSLDDLRRKWQKGVSILQKSRLKYSGNPLYSLPWFMVFGESGAGKSTAVSHARLSAAASEAGPLAHVTNTKNCDWWFFEEAVIIDTAGRYAQPLSQETDDREWAELLELIAVTRKREPVNGLVLVVPAGKLLADSPEDLGDYGRHIRMRLETMTRRLGAKVPIYVMVSKMDQVLGLTELAANLGDEERTQALGLLNKHTDAPAGEFLEQAFSHVQERLRDMGMLLASRSGKKDGKPVLLAGEFAALSPGLTAFVQGVFAKSPYSETPLFRGIFFSSGRQEGQITARTLSGLATFKNHTWRLPNTDSAFFLHNFFAMILPKERGFVRFLDSYLSKVSITRNLGYLVWLCLCFALCSYFSVSFMENRRDLSVLSSTTIAAPGADDSLHATAVKLNTAIDGIKEYTHGITDNWWYYPGKPQTRAVLEELHHKYAKWMREKLFIDNDAVLARTIEGQPPANRRLALAMMSEYLAWTREAMAASSKGQQPPPPLKDLTLEMFNDKGMSIPLNDTFLNRAFLSYVKWEEPDMRKHIEETVLNNLRKYTGLLGNDLSWLTDWLETRGQLKPVTLATYWHDGNPNVQVSPAYTKAAVTRLDAMLAKLEDAAEDKALFNDKVAAYRARYANQYREAWWSMAERFYRGPENYSKPENWHATATDMTGLDNAYYRFIRDMADNFSAVAHLGTPDERDDLPGMFVSLMEAYKAGQEPEGGKKLTEKVAEAAATQKQNLEVALSSRKSEAQARVAQSTPAFNDFMDTLRKIYLAGRTDSEAMALAGAGFSGGADAGKTPVSDAMAQLGTLESSLDPRASSNRVFWELVEGPLAYHTSLVVYRAACNLNSLWEYNVLSFGRRYSPEARWEALFGEDGSAEEFVNGPAKPFIHFRKGQWEPATWMGTTFPAKPDFLSFIGLGQVQYSPPRDEYPVHIAALPVNVNDEAEKPYRVRLTLSCGQDLQEIDNYNYPVEENFTWKYSGCGETSLEIFFNTLTLKKTWKDSMAFKTFLSRFRGSALRLTPEDFPGQKEQLASLGVKHIDVRYRLEGAGEILGIQSLPVINTMPSEAAYCRNDLSSDQDAAERITPIPLKIPEPPLAPQKEGLSGNQPAGPKVKVAPSAKKAQGGGR